MSNRARMSESFLPSCASAIPRAVLPWLYLATGFEKGPHLKGCNVPRPVRSQLPKQSTASSTRAGMQRSARIEQEKRPASHPSIDAGLSTPGSVCSLLLRSLRRWLDDFSSCSPPFPPSTDDTPSSLPATMPNLLLRPFLRRSGPHHVQPKFPSKQLFVLGTSSRRHPKVECCREFDSN